MEDTPLDRLVRFYGRDRFGHLYLRAWRYLVDGTGQWLGLPDYLAERILDHALAELDARLDDLRSSIDTRPAVLTFACGWEYTREQLRFRKGLEGDETDDGAFWESAAAELDRDESGSLTEAFFDALDALGDPRYRIVLLQDTIAEGPATPSIVAESTGVPQRGTARLRAEARAVLRTLLLGSIPAAARWSGRDP